MDDGWIYMPEKVINITNIKSYMCCIDQTRKWQKSTFPNSNILAEKIPNRFASKRGFTSFPGMFSSPPLSRI